MQRKRRGLAHQKLLHPPQEDTASNPVQIEREAGKTIRIVDTSVTTRQDLKVPTPVKSKACHRRAEQEKGNLEGCKQ